jgi:hypothetical protein
MDLSALTSAIHGYFAGERHEMYAILVGSLGVVLIAGALHLAARDDFSRGFGAAALILALLLASTALTLLRRDPPHEAALVSALQGSGGRRALDAEAQRMTVVIGKYPGYRYAALVIGVAALLAAAFVRRGIVTGLAAGALLLVVAQAAIDHYSEARARRYTAQLDAAQAGLR